MTFHRNVLRKFTRLTKRTVKRLLLGMGKQMALQVTLIEKFRFTMRTMKRFFLFFIFLKYLQTVLRD